MCIITVIMFIDIYKDIFLIGVRKAGCRKTNSRHWNLWFYYCDFNNFWKGSEQKLCGEDLVTVLQEEDLCLEDFT